MSLLDLEGIRKPTKSFYKIKQWPKNVGRLFVQRGDLTVLTQVPQYLSFFFPCSMKLPAFTRLIHAKKCSRHRCPSFLELTHLNLKRQMLLLIQLFLSISKGVGVRTPTIPKFGNVQVSYIKRCTICI